MATLGADTADASAVREFTCVSGHARDDKEIFKGRPVGVPE